MNVSRSIVLFSLVSFVVVLFIGRTFLLSLKEELKEGIIKEVKEELRGDIGKETTTNDIGDIGKERVAKLKSGANLQQKVEKWAKSIRGRKVTLVMMTISMSVDVEAPIKDDQVFVNHENE